MGDNSFVETEAEFQARLEARIRRALPTIPANITIERNLHLRLGHRTIIIDGLKQNAEDIRGRYDILVKVDDKPLLIAELKAPDVHLSEDDIRQALSYARLHEPMVPLVMVTNGTNTQLRQTYDGSPLETSDFSTGRLESILDAAATLAASSLEDAIQILLGTSKDAWVQLFYQWTDEVIGGLTGDICDFKYPITHEFSIQRAIVDQLGADLISGSRVLVLHGPPLSGVTNVLAQFARKKENEPILFIDGKACSDILQFIANRLSRELSKGISKDDLRSWFNTRSGLQDMTFVIDGIPRHGIDELIENASSGLYKLVIGMDSEMYKRCSTIEGRVQQSQLGRVSDVLELLPLTDEEFEKAQEVLYTSFQAMFFNGAQYISHLRLPRKLRVLAALLPKKEAFLAVEGNQDNHIKISPIIDLMMLEKCSLAFGSLPMLKNDFQMLASAFLEDVELHISDLDWLVTIWGRPSIDPSFIEQKVGRERVDRLLEQGFLSWIDTKNLGPRLLICVEELLAHHVAEEWTKILAKISDQTSIVSELKHLCRLSNIIPSGEVALAAAIFRAVKKNSTLLSITIPYLMSQKPITKLLTQGAEIDILFKDKNIRFQFGEGMNEEIVGNLEPWLVLSHLASFPMVVEGYEKTMNFSIFADLGASSHFLHRPSPTDAAHVQRLHFHEISGIGSVPCLATGIVEPLLQSMLDYAGTFPHEFVSLAQHALDEKKVHLAWRLLTVAIVSNTTTDVALQRAAEDVEKVLRVWWGDVLDEMLKQHGA